MQYKLNKKYKNEIKKKMAILDNNLVLIKKVNILKDNEVKKITKTIDEKCKQDFIWNQE